VYGLGHHSSRSRGKCIVSSVSRDIASLLLISPEIGYFSCTQNEQRLLHTVLAGVYSFTGQFLTQITSQYSVNPLNLHYLYFMIFVR